MPEDRNPCFSCEHKHEPKNSGVCDTCTKPYFYTKALGEDDQFIKQIAVKAPKKEETMPDAEPNATIDKIIESQKNKKPEGPIKACKECSFEYDETECEKNCEKLKKHKHYLNSKKTRNTEKKTNISSAPQTITLNFSCERDIEILKQIRKLAKADRRSPDQQIIYILEKTVSRVPEDKTGIRAGYDKFGARE